MESKTKKTAAVKVTKPAVKKVAVKKPEVAAKVAIPKTVVKEVVKEPKTVAAKKTVVKTESKEFSVSVNVLGIDGKAAGTMTLPTALFGVKINKVLLAQAIRVYLANQRQGNASTLTRGEVTGSTRKIYRQKGTGRARHGGVRAPIFVKGGIVFGPKPKDFGLELPTKMKRAALLSAFSAKAKEKQVTVLADLPKLEAKTKQFAAMLKATGLASKKQNLLFVTSAATLTNRQAGQNIPGVTFINAKQVTAYEVISTNMLVLDKTTIDELKARFEGGVKNAK